MCSVGKEAKETLRLTSATTLHVQRGQLRVWSGRRVIVYVMANRLLHSKRKKRRHLQLTID
jgi:hypothetical protein